LRDEGVLIVGTGALTHNLRMAFAKGLRNRVAEVPDWVAGFTDWIADKAAAGEADALVAFETDAPHAALHHPTPEHFLPFFVALGAAGEGAVGERIHASTEFAVLAMDCFAFGQPGEMAPRAMAVESVS